MVALTDEDKAMRDGRDGDAVAAAMDLLIRYADALGAEEFCDTRNVAGTNTQPSPAKARLVREGGWARAFSVLSLDSDTTVDVPRMKVPTCQLQHGFGDDALGIMPYPEENIRLQADAESFYSAKGVNILATCTPYQAGNVPAYGEHIAWMESSAVVYANSVLGARTNCEGGASTGSASLTGRIPCWGNHHTENRYGTHHIEATVPIDSFHEWGMLGYFTGDAVQEARPVITGSLHPAGLADLKHFGAAAATSGGVEMYHIPGRTPDAPTLQAAFGTTPPPPPLRYGPEERRAVHEQLNSLGTSTDVDFVLLGCPHASLDQIGRIAHLLEDRTLSPHTELWIMTPLALRTVADRNGWTATIERAGGRLLTDSCPAMSRTAPAGTRVFATDSAKQAHYLPAILGIEAWYGTTEECVDAALTGRWTGHLTPPADTP
ncbi:aconitase X [Streptomyces tagetis]|uniref:Aconitase X catalytic domain-containing protein n=1 Tax=Streptomyces tagetis TaxID=2820809 RepID=A0A941B0D6_9ACTN|nr:aconitase X catalytic domain-containing protein [Streptomyces sp. RG38]MBQ0827215.1 aconitase X catalytic domain-containing protein [Streptomyces sp. RG38]